MSRAVKMLLQGGWITKEQFDQAMVAAARRGETPGYHLVQMGAIADEDLVDFFVRTFPLRYWPRFRIKKIQDSVIRLMTPRLARALRVIPITSTGENLTIGITDPSLTHVAEEAAYHTKRFINPVLLSESDMTWALDRYYPVEKQPGAGNSEKPPAVLERETHDFIAAHLAPERKIPAVVNVTDGGWDMDAWGIADIIPDDDDALPLHIPRTADPRPAGRDAVRAMETPERPSLFSLSPESRTTLPPPPIKPSAAPGVRHSIASMMLGAVTGGAQESAAVAPSPSESDVRKSTDDLLVPRGVDPEAVDVDRAAPGQSGDAVPGRKTISDVMEVIHRSQSRDEIVNATLEFLLLFARRAAFLLVRKDEIRGFAIRGEDTHLTAIKSYWIPYDSESTFRRTAESRQIHLGPFGRTVSDAVFSAALGGRPRRVLVIPVTIHDRTAALLYADKLRIDMPPWNLLERIAEVTGSALYRLLMERRRN